MNAHATVSRSFDPILADAWRINSQEVVESIRFVKQYQRVIEEAGSRLRCGVLVHHPAYVELCKKLLPWRLSLYLEQVRSISEAEARMDEIGMAYALSSDDWRVS